jgi:uncharacterized protein (TIGR03083 family)
MGERALRHHYSDTGVELRVDPALGDVVEPWARHRARFDGVLASLSDEQWSAQSRCAAWSNRDVVSHLVDVDAFWTVSLESGRAGEPTTYLRDFDPEHTPLALVDARATMSTGEILEAFRTNGARLRKAVDSFGPDDWEKPCESPIGHVSARLTLAHALWDSWLHERDVLLGLGLAEDAELDELAVVTWYSLLFGGAQGGLLDDPEPVGPGPTERIDAQLSFDELPMTPMRIVVDRGVYVGPADSPKPAGSAEHFVDALTGRTDVFPPEGVALDPALVGQLGRARQIL